jgi:hypothetical protein
MSASGHADSRLLMVSAHTRARRSCDGCLACTHFFVGRMLLQLSCCCGGCHRRSPTGGAANGTPRKCIAPLFPHLAGMPSMSPRVVCATVQFPTQGCGGWALLATVVTTVMMAMMAVAHACVLQKHVAMLWCPMMTRPSVTWYSCFRWGGSVVSEREHFPELELLFTPIGSANASTLLNHMWSSAAESQREQRASALWMGVVVCVG